MANFRRDHIVALLALMMVASLAGRALAQDAAADKKDEKRVLEVGKWYPFLETGLNLTQSAYSSNWKGGETGSISWSAYLNATAEKQINPSINWLNTIKLLYGQSRDEVEDADGDRHWGSVDENNDQADLEALFRLTKGWGVDPYLSLRLETYFRDVDDPFGRDLWFNPMTFKESVGIARKVIDLEDHQMLARLGVTFRETKRTFFVADTGDETDDESAWDSGAEIVVDYMRVFNPSLTYTSRLSLYQPFNWSKKDVFEGLGADSLSAAGLDADIADYTTTADIDWQNTISAKVTKLIAVQLYVELLYDQYDNTVVPTVDPSGSLTNADVVGDAVRKKGQFKQTLGIGLVWTFK